MVGAFCLLIGAVFPGGLGMICGIVGVTLWRPKQPPKRPVLQKAMAIVLFVLAAAGLVMAAAMVIAAFALAKVLLDMF